MTKALFSLLIIEMRIEPVLISQISEYNDWLRDTD